MAKAICAKSGLPFQVQYFPYSFDSGTITHPIFTLNYLQLTSQELLNKYLNREFSDTDTKLYFLALLNTSELVEWKTYARPTIQTCEQNLVSLIDILEQTNSMRNVKSILPSVCISQETADLNNIKYWIDNWQKALEDYATGYKLVTAEQELLRKENLLTQLINNSKKEVASFAKLLADWACLAGDFPTFAVTINNTETTCAEYWKHILITCGKSQAHIWRLELTDMRELLTHLEDNLEHGSLYAYHTLKLLRDGIETYNSYLGYDIINSPNDIEVVNIKNLAAQAPALMPRLRDYPNKIAYYRDKSKWDAAQRQLAAQQIIPNKLIILNTVQTKAQLDITSGADTGEDNE